MKKLALGAGLALLLTACGSPTTPTTPNPTTPNPTPTTRATLTEIPPQPGDIPAGALRVKVFTFRDPASARATIGAQQLSALNLQAQDLTAQDWERFRVVLAVTRSGSGASIGQKRATVRLIWGNASTPLDVRLHLGLTDASKTEVEEAESIFSLKVTPPDFQAATTRSTKYRTITGQACARLFLRLTPSVTGQEYTEVEACEDSAEQQALVAALQKAASGLLYTHDSAAGAKFEWVSISNRADFTYDELLGTMNLPPSATPTTQDAAEFFAPLTALPAGESATWTAEQKAQATLARKYAALYKALQTAYGKTLKVTRGMATGSRETILIHGQNAAGHSGMRTYRFLKVAGADPASSNSLGTATARLIFTPRPESSWVTTTLQVQNAPENVYGSAQFLSSRSNRCEPFASDYLSYFPRSGRNSEGLWFSDDYGAHSDSNSVVIWNVTLYDGDHQRTISGYTCHQPRPLTLENVDVSPDFRTRSLYDPPVRYAELYLSNMTPSMTYAATYRLADDPECGEGTSTPVQTGTFTAYEVDDVDGEWAALEIPNALSLPGLGPSTAMFWKVTLSDNGQSVVKEGKECHDMR